MVQAVSQAIGSVFLVAAPIAALGFVVVLFLKEYPLGGSAGGEAVDKENHEMTGAGSRISTPGSTFWWMPFYPAPQYHRRQPDGRRREAVSVKEVTMREG